LLHSVDNRKNDGSHTIGFATCFDNGTVSGARGDWSFIASSGRIVSALPGGNARARIKKGTIDLVAI
jgi:hypothetical protein